jgi:ubiquinone/menaquinone biosynthesis C-methylase UbiE
VRFLTVNTARERAYERKHILSQRERYLACDVMEKARTDIGYAEKVLQIENALARTSGWVLDIGASTCGESEYLVAQGYSIIATDINEIALGISKERCAKFSRPSPYYLACDGQHLSLQSQSAHFVILNEALHHMEDPFQTMREVSRVLVPGGRVFLHEPYAFNPYRRLSEIRDSLRGTIERSFSVGELKDLLQRAGLNPVSIQRHPCRPSDWKMQALGSFHRTLRRAYFSLSERIPQVLGNVMLIAEKQGTLATPAKRPSFESILRCPATGSPVIGVNDADGFLSLAKEFRGFYPNYRGIPVLIREEVRHVGEAAWQAMLDSVSKPSGAISQ